MRPGGFTKGTLAVTAAACLAAVPALAAKPQKPGATYTAFTSQGDHSCQNGTNDQPCTIFIGVSKDGKKATIQVRWFATCSDKVVYRSATTFSKLRIKKGKYSKNASYTDTLSDGTTGDNKVHIDGRFKHSGKKYTVSGKFTVTSTLHYHEGGGSTCKSGKVTYLAKAP